MVRKGFVPVMMWVGSAFALHVGVLIGVLVLHSQSQTGTEAPPNMVLVPAGEFIMGVNYIGGQAGPYADEYPAHKVYVPSFYIDIYEVTNEEYKRFCDATGYPPPPHWEGGKYPEGQDKFPVNNVSWYDAVEYCKWAGKRLPTEAEWEKAARGTDGRMYPWGNEFTDDKNNPYKFCNGGHRGLKPVGSYPQGVSPYGCYDMVGNVAEWTSDWYKPYPGAKEGTVYDAFYGEKLKVHRGGSWANFPSSLRCTFRGTHYPWGRSLLIGFRCAKSAPEATALHYHQWHILAVPLMQVSVYLTYGLANP